MPFFTTSLRRALQASVLFLATTTSAQSCFYPDGSLSPDTPCSTSGHSSCCNADSFCLDNGLCYGGGIVSRGSCTDDTWGSDACAGFCKTESPDAGIAITPCADRGGENNTFTCGLDNAGCQNEDSVWTLGGLGVVVLRSSQVADLLGPAQESSSTSPESTTSSIPATNGTTMYTSSQMAGLGCGLGLPLAFFLVVALCMLHKEKQKHAGPKLMYKLPDNHQEFISQVPQLHQNNNLRAHSNFSIDSRQTGGFGSRGLERENSILTMDSSRPAQAHSFLDRYDSMKSNRASQIMVHEMDGASPHDPVRFELSDKRFSTPTGN